MRTIKKKSLTLKENVYEKKNIQLKEVNLGGSGSSKPVHLNPTSIATGLNQNGGKITAQLAPDPIEPASVNVVTEPNGKVTPETVKTQLPSSTLNALGKGNRQVNVNAVVPKNTSNTTSQPIAEGITFTKSEMNDFLNSI